MAPGLSLLRRPYMRAAGGDVTLTAGRTNPEGEQGILRTTPEGTQSVGMLPSENTTGLQVFDAQGRDVTNAVQRNILNPPVDPLAGLPQETARGREMMSTLRRGFTEDQSAAKRLTDDQRAMLKRGVYLAPSAFEAGFVSSAHGDAEIAHTLEAARAAFREVAAAA
jgi:hypothetical protein